MFFKDPNEKARGHAQVDGDAGLDLGQQRLIESNGARPQHFDPIQNADDAQIADALNSQPQIDELEAVDYELSRKLTRFPSSLATYLLVAIAFAAEVYGGIAVAAALGFAGVGRLAIGVALAIIVIFAASKSVATDVSVGAHRPPKPSFKRILIWIAFAAVVVSIADGHVVVPLAQREFVDGDAAHLAEGAALGAALEVGAQDLLHEVPADAEEDRGGVHRHLAQQVEREAGEGPRVGFARVGDLAALVAARPALAADEHLQMQDEEHRLPADGQRLDRGGLVAVGDHDAAAAGCAAAIALLLLDMEMDRAADVLRTQVAVGLSTERVVNEARGHRGPPCSLSRNSLLSLRCPRCPIPARSRADLLADVVISPCPCFHPGGNRKNQKEG